jgi:hypothetical protein
VKSESGAESSLRQGQFLNFFCYLARNSEARGSCLRDCISETTNLVDAKHHCVVPAVSDWTEMVQQQF